MSTRAHAATAILSITLVVLASPALAQQAGGPPDADMRIARQLSTAFRSAAEEALPSVVFIRVEKEAGTDMHQQVPGMPDPFEFFFGPRRQPEEMPPQRGAGSGFVYDREGRIITNAHVVSDATYILVTLRDGREFEAELVGADRSTDVAVIRIEPPDGAPLEVAELGDSDDVRVGDWVLALGSPLGLDFTVTAGIVSAKGRGGLGGAENALESYIQTDAAINPGNSGGPLVDLEARVIGINTAIFGGGARFVGYGFAIPIDLAERVIGDLLEYGFVRRPRLGIRVGDITAVDAEVYGLTDVRGAEVAAVDEDGPAAEVGLEAGDVILAIDGEEIRDATDLTATLARREPGEQVRLTVFRDGERRSVTVELGEFEQAERVEARAEAGREMERTLGFRVRPITSDLARQFELDERDGVVITSVDRYGAAAAAGVRPGQVLLRVDGERIDSVRDVEDAVQDVEPGDVVSLRVRVRGMGETVINYRVRG